LINKKGCKKGERALFSGSGIEVGNDEPMLPRITTPDQWSGEFKFVETQGIIHAGSKVSSCKHYRLKLHQWKESYTQGRKSSHASNTE
jgi:hypothetical protein